MITVDLINHGSQRSNYIAEWKHDKGYLDPSMLDNMPSIRAREKNVRGSAQVVMDFWANRNKSTLPVNPLLSSVGAPLRGPHYLPKGTQSTYGVNLHQKHAIPDADTGGYNLNDVSMGFNSYVQVPFPVDIGGIWWEAVQSRDKKTEVRKQKNV